MLLVLLLAVAVMSLLWSKPSNSIQLSSTEASSSCPTLLATIIFVAWDTLYARWDPLTPSSTSTTLISWPGRTSPTVLSGLSGVCSLSPCSWLSPSFPLWSLRRRRLWVNNETIHCDYTLCFQQTLWTSSMELSSWRLQPGQTRRSG